MAVLSALKLVTAARVHVTNPVNIRREKLVKKLADQYLLVQARQAVQAAALFFTLARHSPTAK